MLGGAVTKPEASEEEETALFNELDDYLLEASEQEYACVARYLGDT
jgi:hypothetical protein